MVEEYLTIAEVAARLKMASKTVKDTMRVELCQKGVRYLSLYWMSRDP